MKKLVSITSTVAMLGSMLMPLAAADNSSTNSITGYGSTNVSNVTNTNSATVTNVSDTKIVNDVRTVSNTGGNTASFNTLGGAVSSGNAVNNVSLLNTGNINTTTVKVGTVAGNETGNSITGAESTNTSAVTNTNNVSVRNDNTAWIKNEVDAESLTGHNTASNNTGAGSAMSGNATTNVSSVTRVNDSATAVTLGMGGTGGNSGFNDTTGFKSYNLATVLNSNNVEVDNISDARVLNHVDTKSATGMNDSSFNTLGGSVHSGNAATGVGLDTTGNINTTTVAVAMGGFANVAGSEITGAESTNITGVTNSNLFKVENWNNKGMSYDAKDYECGAGALYTTAGRPCWGVYNFDEDFSLTGQNSGSFNTGLASVLSGVATIQKTVKTWLNDSFQAIN
jgi:hypothetical protein